MLREEKKVVGTRRGKKVFNCYILIIKKANFDVNGFTTIKLNKNNKDINVIFFVVIYQLKSQ